MRDKLLIFDFDGTIADTKSIYYSVMVDELKVFGYTEKDVDKIIDLGFSLRKTLKKLGLGFIVSWWLHKKIMGKIKTYAEKVKKCKDVDAIRKIRYRKIVVSNSLREFMMPILKHFGLMKEFDGIYGSDDFNNKIEFIKDYLKNSKIDRENCYYIGDRTADVKVARKIGCKSIIVSGKCAWDSRKEILKANPDFIIDDIKNLKEVFGIV